MVDETSSDDVFVLELDGGRGEPVRLTDGPAKEFDPALSPDGEFIAFRVNPRPDSDEADIWVMRLDGTGRRNLTRSPEDLNWAPAWSADGRIVYASQRGSPGQPQLWTMAADGSDQRRVGRGMVRVRRAVAGRAVRLLRGQRREVRPRDRRRRR